MLDECIHAAMGFILLFGTVWGDLTYYFFLYQQRLDPSRLREPRGENAIIFLFIIPAVFLGLPSGEEEFKKDYRLKDWRLFPGKIVWLLLLAALAWGALHWLPAHDRLREEAVLAVYWPAFLCGLLVIVVTERLLIRLLFRLKECPYIPTTVATRGTLFKALGIIGVVIFLAWHFSCEVIPFWRCPNIVYK